MFLHGVLASVLVCSVSAAAPVITLQNGVFTGALNSTTGIESFKGIRYAQPPARFRAPEPVTASSAAQNATAFGSRCAQLGSGTEDCLFLNIFRPVGTEEGSDLATLIWVHGGSYISGAGSDFNPDLWMQRSVEIGKPIVFVSINYRLGQYGFLASSKVDAGDLNAGLRDQELAFQFVKDNAKSFGGDPDKLTIWGQSAGASAIGLHLLYADPAKGLFRAAIMDSGGPTQYPLNDPGDFDAPDAPYTTLVSLTGCSNASDSLQCMRDLPFDQMFNATSKQLASLASDATSTVFPPVVDGTFISERASKRLADGTFNNVPIISGTNVDEGTEFTPSGINSTETIRKPMLTSVLWPPEIPDDIFSEILKLYPNDPTVGSPFGTGTETFGLNPIYKEAAAIFGDWKYHSTSRLLLQTVANLTSRCQPAYGFLWGTAPPGDNAPQLGVHHSSELEFSMQVSAANSNASFAALADEFRDAYINFVVDLVPRRTSGKPWKTYGAQSNVLQLKADNITGIQDTYRQEQLAFFMDRTVLDVFSK